MTGVKVNNGGVMRNITQSLTEDTVVAIATHVTSIPNVSHGNNSNSSHVADEEAHLNWGVLALSVLIVATAIGNVLVCLAVCWEKRLQNMTNYFLMSLAIADLLVSLLVMPFGLIVEIYGYFPLAPSLCVIWATMDVLLCTASIWHMCTMSMDRFFTLKYPMKYGRNKTKTMVALKILFVWVVSIAISSPVSVVGFLNYESIYNGGACVPTIRDFIIYGSLFAFYVPLTIMVVTYVLTIKILCNNQKLMRSIVKDHSARAKSRKEKNGTYTTTYLSPHSYTPRFMDRPSVDTSVSVNASINDTSVCQSNLSSPKEEKVIPIVAEPVEDEEKQSLVDDACNERLSMHGSYHSQPNLSVSQPHLPSMLSPMSSPSFSQHSLLLPRASSQQRMGHSRGGGSHANFNFGMVSGASSVNSMLSHAHYGSDVFSDFEDHDLIDKLSMIEQEMDECLQDNGDPNEPLTQEHSSSEDEDEKQGDEEEEEEGKEESHVEDKLMEEPPACKIVPPVTVSSPASDDTLEDSESESGLITIQLKPSGCYLYRVDYRKSGLSPARDNGCTRPLTNDIHNGMINEKRNSSDLSADEADEAMSTSVSTSTGFSTRIYSPQGDRKAKSLSSRSGWRALLRHNAKKNKRNRRRERVHAGNGVLKQIISKRTASNEKKASKVLGIIFAVFVVLWTPFFIVNILAVVCQSCLEKVTPSAMAAIVWLGYLSSLANPLIYTMFNTAFRRAFVKILTCTFQRNAGKSMATPDTVALTNATRWPSDRRNTMTLTLKEY